MFILTTLEIKRFWSKVDKTDYCWNWTASTRQGYGAIKLRYSVWDAHRISWEIHYGEIPDGFDVCHSCDNRKCINPNHLFVGTRKDNMQDALYKNRLTSKYRAGVRPIRI